MLEAWLNRTRQWLSLLEKLLPLPEQEFAGWALARLNRPASAAPQHWMVTTVCGEPGSGKSSLVRQALRQPSSANRRKIVVAEAHEWSRWIAEMSESGRPILAAGDIDCIVCENVHHLVDQAGDGDRLASWLDQAREQRVPVIVTADGLPSHIDHLSPRLVNRLQGGLLAGIRPLSEDSQQRLLEHWSTQDAVSPPLRNRVISPLITTAGQLRRMLTDRTSRPARSGPATAANTDLISLELVADLVAEEFHVPVAELCSGTRMQSLKIPRGVAMSLARELTSYPLTTISRHFGCRSHTAVVRSCSRLQQLIPNSPSLRQQLQQLRAKLGHSLSADCG